MSSLTSLALVALIGCVLWKVVRRYLVGSPLDNIPGPEATSRLQGHLPEMFDRHGWDFHDRITEQYGSVVKLYGPLKTRGLYVSDPRALNNIIVKDQMIYEEPGWFLSWNQMVFGPSLFATLGDHHRRQRKMLNPVFSISHMRHMTPIFYRTVHRLREAVAVEIGDSATEVNMLDWMGRTALELIGQGGLGYSFDPLTVRTKNEFGDALKQFAPTSFSLQLWRVLTPHIRPYIPRALGRVFAEWVPHQGAQRIRMISDTMAKQSRMIYNSKIEALKKGDAAIMHQIGEGKDIISILIKANMVASEEDKLSEDELIAQMSALIFAAMDTTSNALSRILHLLAENQDAQNKIRAELMEAAGDGEDIPYDQLVDLPYLDAVCRETLRLYAPVTFLSRETRQDIVMPLAEPIVGKDGTLITEIPVPKDTSVIIGIRACNRNKTIWGEDALEWKPERWLQPLPESVGKAHVPGIYANLMTFLGGGRACIGFKFSQLEMKVVLAVLLRSFRFMSSDKEVYWNLAGINYPTVGKGGMKAALPLKVVKV
ncbi:hypothetical protein PHLGIDRAFT_86237 [Phlebiopsis gigantea 11061_1 CR5-6]|uniref:Cytochrome P450 n=1 Tax=Phlebiopsis gigantea (strain 11061_1 CR5-6) TaxID=745531 RepID=A0A0C3S2R0_PHLG1|nr:hypothetical protein PHLGIDRAFT_86237 [Phlebiopsis gigantea 11061_1 CR5-6]